MQINFFTSPKDEEDLVEYLYGRDGYFIIYKSAKERSYPVLSNLPLPPAEKPGLRSLRLSNTSTAPIPARRWASKTPSFKRDELISGSRGFRFETIEFTRSCSDGSKLYPGRLWLNGLEDQTARFYQSICRHIRKTFTKDEAGWWVGPTTDSYCRDKNLEKANFAFPTS